MTFQIGIGPNNRKSAYFDATVAEGVACFSVYNHMFIPAHYGDPEGEYDALMNGVAMWDVAAQRQVELSGPDAARLIQYLTTRDMSNTRIGQGRYVPMCDHQGRLINDPVLLMLAQDRYWLSIADSDIALWASAIAAERGWDVTVAEPDVSPLAVQGPKAEAVITALFGDWVRDLRYFGFKQTQLGDIPLVLARSGWSKQGGFEMYLQDSSRGGELWAMVKAAGAPFGIRPGAPNDVERIESGLVSYGADGRLQTNPCTPYDIGLGKLVDLETPDDFIGKEALRRIADEGAQRERSGFVIAGAPLTAAGHSIPVLDDKGQPRGVLSDYVYSKRFKANIGVGMIASDAKQASLHVVIGDEARKVTLRSLPFDS